METIKLKINGIEVTAPKGSTILEAARLAHIEIPTLCFLKEINEIGACRVCIVELKNGKLVTSCVYPAEEGMEVSVSYTHLDVYKRQVSVMAFCAARIAATSTGGFKGRRWDIRFGKRTLIRRTTEGQAVLIKGCLLYTSRCV